MLGKIVTDNLMVGNIKEGNIMIGIIVMGNIMVRKVTGIVNVEIWFIEI